MVFFPKSLGCLEWTETGLCSGHGVCVTNISGSISTIILANVPDSWCQCASGYTGNGDWIDSHPYDCPHPIVLVMFFYSLQLCASCVAISVIVYKLTQIALSILEKLQEVSSSAKTQSRTVPRSPAERDRGGNQSQNKSFCKEFSTLKSVRLNLLSLPTPLCYLIISAMRLQSPQSYLIGQAYGTTLLRVIGTIFFWSYGAYFTESWLLTAVDIARVTGKSIPIQPKRLKLLFRSAMLTVFVNTLFLLVSPPLQTLFFSHILTFCFIHTAALTAAAFGYAVIPSGRSLRALLLMEIERLPEEQRLEREKTSVVLLRLVGNFRSAVIQNVVLGFVFAYWPWLRTYYMFLFAFQGSVMCIVLTVNASILAPPRRIKVGSKGSKEPSKATSKVALKDNMLSPPTHRFDRSSADGICISGENGNKDIMLPIKSNPSPSRTFLTEVEESKESRIGRGEGEKEPNLSDRSEANLEHSVSRSAHTDPFEEYQNPLSYGPHTNTLEVYPEGEEKEEDGA